MEHQNTTPNEQQEDIYELLKKVVESNEENIKSIKQTETIHLESRNFYQSAQNAFIESSHITQQAIELLRKELESIQNYKNSIPDSIPADLSEKTIEFLENFQKKSLLLKYLFLGSIGILILSVIILFTTGYFAVKWYSESIQTKSEIRQEIFDEIKKDGKEIYKLEDYNQLKHNTNLINKWMKKNPKDGEKFMKFKEGYESK